MKPAEAFLALTDSNGQPRGGNVTAERDTRGEVRKVGWFQYEALMPVGRARSGSWLVERRATRWGANRALKELRNKVSVKPDRSTKGESK